LIARVGPKFATNKEGHSLVILAYLSYGSVFK
jgi:hypothetical protein